jgi:hypothetical protein
VILFDKIRLFLNRKRLTFIYNRIPISIFLLGVLFDSFTRNLSESEYWVIYFKGNELLKSGLLPSIGFLLSSFIMKQCYYNKVSILGMISWNIVNYYFIGSGHSEQVYESYMNLFSNFVMIPTAILALILLIKKI